MTIRKSSTRYLLSLLFAGLVAVFCLVQAYPRYQAFVPFRATWMKPGAVPRASYAPLTPASPAGDGFTFAVTADMRSFTGPGIYDTPAYFRGAAQTIADMSNPAFVISPGDIDQPLNLLWTLTSTIGASTLWYPVIGNHELPGQGSEPTWGANLAWLNNYDYGAVNPGPSTCPQTTYSFDYGNVHFVAINEYCNSAGDSALDGDISNTIYNWLAADLAATEQPFILVFGHEPAYPWPDADNGRLRHLGDSLDKYPSRRDDFWNLLHQYHVTAYICGHTHNYSAVVFSRVWQIDAGHARGLGDTGARSTFLLFHVSDQDIVMDTYRDDASGGVYSLAYQTTIAPLHTTYFPLIVR